MHSSITLLQEILMDVVCFKYVVQNLLMFAMLFALVSTRRHCACCEKNKSPCVCRGGVMKLGRGRGVEGLVQSARTYLFPRKGWVVGLGNCVVSKINLV